MKSTITSLLLAVAMAAAPAAAQEPTEDKPAEAEEKATEEKATDSDALQKELTDIQQRLAEAEQKAMADPKVLQMQKELEAKVEAESKKIDPEFDKKVEKLTSLQEQLLDAQQAGDEARMQQIATEGMQLQQDLQATQEKALANEEIAAAMKTYQDLVREKMLEAEPQTDKLIERGNAIVIELQRAPET